jgi:ribonucrease Y
LIYARPVILWVSIAAGFGVLAGIASAAVSQRRSARHRLRAARAEAAALRKGARLESASLRRAAQTAAREAALEQRSAADRNVTQLVEALARREERVAKGEAELAEEKRVLDAEWARFKERKRALQSTRDRAAHGLSRAGELLGQMRESLAERVGEGVDEFRARMERRWIDDATAAASNRIRALDATAADPDIERAARRIMDVAASRYKNHFLTERLISNIALEASIHDQLMANDSALLHAVGEVANVQLNVNEDGTALRLEGLDGVGREIARRALSRLARPRHQQDAAANPQAWVAKIRDQLGQEIVNLGKKAFAVLQVRRAHPEIVELVGRLNYRTSYTQNQWLHAVEASFLAGMMADELGLDVKLARRACLMHDIGKSLTHEIDGSHAVIGADIARRLGEDEIVSNAIGAHHADEPPGSVYAYLVAAGDAMSGARPGARRMMTAEYGNRIEDLERIGTSYRGVDRAFAVHGGRELRVYVEEGRLSDRDAVQLATDISHRISEEMTFPGQIKVTVIRAYEAVSVAN